ncbi:hypothetical protein [Rubritalea tangerina]|uniref:hypothetical protein n=1 Tax=Rubritalea tangerina TaxID=430798 RepID=UPI0036192762
MNFNEIRWFDYLIDRSEVASFGHGGVLVLFRRLNPIPFPVRASLVLGSLFLIFDC